MPVTLTDKDISRLKALHPDLEAAVMQCAALCDQPFTVFEGMRTKQRQAAYVKKGVSRTMRSYHIVGLAVDLVPLMPDKNNKLQPMWNAGACRLIAMAMSEAVARLRKTAPDFPTVTWGGTWKFFDGPHFQLDVPYAEHPRTTAYLDGVPYMHQRANPAASVGSYANKATAPARVADNARNAPTNDAVRTIQQGINWLREEPATAQALSKVPPVVVDGKYGPATHKAVMTVQQFLGVKPDGLWGAKTQKAFEARVRGIAYARTQVELQAP